MTSRVIASTVLIVSLLVAWAAPAAADQPARGKAEDLARQARTVNRWLREHPDMAEKIIRSLRGSRPAEARQPARRQPAAPAPRRAPAPPAAARTHVWSGWMRIRNRGDAQARPGMMRAPLWGQRAPMLRRPEPQRRPGMMMPGQRLGQRGGMMSRRAPGPGMGRGGMMMRARGRGPGMGRGGAMMRGRGRGPGMGRGGMMMRGRGRGQAMGRRGPAVCPHCGRPMGPGRQSLIERYAPRPESRRPDLWRSRARTARPNTRGRILAGIGERLRQRFRERAVARERMDHPLWGRKRTEPARRGREMDRPRRDTDRRLPSPRLRDRSEAGRRGPRERGDRRAPEAARRRERPEAGLRDLAERLERQRKELAEMAKALERRQQELKRLAEKLRAAHGEAKGDKERPRPREGDRPR